MTGFARPELLATTEWLAERLDDPSVRIVDCDEFPRTNGCIFPAP